MEIKEVIRFEMEGRGEGLGGAEGGGGGGGGGVEHGGGG